MKKLVSLLLCLMMLAVAGFACAESVEDLYAGEWVQITDGPKLYIPEGWVELEITEEFAADGLFYAVATPDYECTCQLYWFPLDEDMEVEELLVEMEAAFPGCELLDLGNAAFVCFADMEADVLGFAALDANEPGLYQFMFTPASNEDLQLVASAIVASMTE